MVADDITCTLSKGDYRQAIQTASNETGKLAIKAALGTAFSALYAVAELNGLALEFFYDSLVETAINNQTKLYRTARMIDYSYADIMSKFTKPSDLVMYDDGWLYIVDENTKIPSYGAVRPGNYTREQVYGGLEQEYQTDLALKATYLQEKKKIAEEFAKLVQPTITYSPSEPSAPTEVTFQASGELTNLNIAPYLWEFGDGQSAYGQSVSHLYKAPKAYIVRLTMTDASGALHIIDETVVVRPPEITVSYPGSSEDLHLQFSTPDSPLISQYTWNYGDGSPPESGSRTRDHYYPTSGYYTATLTVTLDDGSTIQSQRGLFVGPGTKYIQGHTIYSSETWHTGGTYVVQGSISIAQGAKLIIEPGVQVKWGATASLWVSGTLTASGVTFTAADSQQPWQGIGFLGTGASASRLENCRVEGASGLNLSNARSVVYIQDAAPTITGCTLNGIGNDSYGIWVNGNATITNNTLSGFGNGKAIWVAGGSPTVTGNTIIGNSNPQRQDHLHRYPRDWLSSHGQRLRRDAEQRDPGLHHRPDHGCVPSHRYLQTGADRRQNRHRCGPDHRLWPELWSDVYRLLQPQRQGVAHGQGSRRLQVCRLDRLYRQSGQSPAMHRDHERGQDRPGRLQHHHAGHYRPERLQDRRGAWNRREYRPAPGRQGQLRPHLRCQLPRHGHRRPDRHRHVRFHVCRLDRLYPGCDQPSPMHGSHEYCPHCQSGLHPASADRDQSRHRPGDQPADRHQLR